MSTNSKFTPRCPISRFLVPSCLGLLLFLCPFPIQGQYSILVSYVARFLLSFVKSYIPYLLIVLFTAMAILTAWGTFMRPSWIEQSPWLQETFVVGRGMLAMRLISVVWLGFVLLDVGPNWLIGSKTGYLICYDLLPTLWVNMVISSLFLPLLLEFGLVEFIAVFIEPIMRPLFRLPGRAAMNCLVAWIGDGSVGSIIAIDEYKKKNYNAQEVSIVISCFSAVSITFCLSMLAQVQLEDYFLSFYATVVLSSLIAALVLPRIPPIVWKKSDLTKVNTKAPSRKNRLDRAIALAKKRAITKRFWDIFSKSHLQKITGILISLLPSVLVIGGLSLIIAHYTPFFTLLGMPFVGILRLLGVPEAKATAEVLFVGFADMLIPAVIIAKVANPMTRFIVVCMAVCQLVYLSEIGAVLMGSKVPLSLKDITLVFIIRTIITLPIIILCAHFIF